jgi:hypothetical protein
MRKGENRKRKENLKCGRGVLTLGLPSNIVTSEDEARV